MRSYFALSLLLTGVAAVPFEAGIFEGAKRQAMTSCNRDNCFRAAVGTAFPSRSGDCAAFLRKTVTPCPVTLTSTVFLTATTSTSTLVSTILSTTTTTTVTLTTTTSVQTDTSTVVDTVTSTTTPTVTPTTTLPPAKKKRTDAPACPVTGSASAVPSYASACSGAARYSSACACNSISAATTTLTPVTTTTTVTSIINTIAATQTTTTSVAVVVTVITSTISTATTTVATTVTTTTATSTAPTATAPAQQIENVGNCLSVVGSSVFEQTFDNYVITYGVRQAPGFFNADPPVTLSGDLKPCEAVQTCANIADGRLDGEFGLYRRASDNTWQCVGSFFTFGSGDFTLVDPDTKSSYGYRVPGR